MIIVFTFFLFLQYVCITNMENKVNTIIDYYDENDREKDLEKDDLKEKINIFNYGELIYKEDYIRDCSTVRRYCVYDQDCETICEPKKAVIFKCDENEICYPYFIEDKNDPGKVECDTKHGEYALLVGYTSVGTALWQCVQLYRHFIDPTKFCENGIFDMDANVREPSYKDCTCPSDTIRAVYKISSFYDNAIPHCISEISWKFYKNDMLEV